MKPININYAYNGFLYAPLFLASELGLFPRNMNLVYRNGDIPAIQSLSLKTESSENWFAVCDPFAKDISKIQAEIGSDRICIVGTFIDRLPVWVYNSNPEFEPVGSEEELVDQENKYRVDRIVCYEKFNTGYLIGERLRRKFDFPTSKIIERKFGEEFNTQPDQSELIITSDVLKIVGELDRRNIIFNYPQKSRELNPFLFTAVLTLRSVIENHLYSVLSILAGIRTAISLLHSEYVDPSLISKLVNIYGTAIPQPADAQAETVKNAVMLCTHENIYAEDFDVSRAETAYNTAKNEWNRLFPDRKFPDIEKCNDPIPALLLKKNWRRDKGLIQIFAKELKLKPQITREELSLFNIGAISLAFLIFICSTFLIANNFPLITTLPVEKEVYLWWNLVMYPVQLILLSLIFLDALVPTNFIPRWTYSRYRLSWCVAAMFALLAFQTGLIDISSR